MDTHKNKYTEETFTAALFVLLVSDARVCAAAGAKIGHRLLMRYYRQRFGTQRELVPVHNQRAVGRVLKQYRALGWGGESGEELIIIVIIIIGPSTNCCNAPLMM